MSLFLQAMDKIYYLCKKADVIGTPRISLTFERQIARGQLKPENGLDLSFIPQYEF